MWCRVLARTREVWGVGSPLLTLPWLSGLKAQRCLSCGRVLGGREAGGYADDPQVKEWMKELHQDFKDAKDGRTEGLMKDVEIEEAKDESKEETGSNPQKVWSRLVMEKYGKLDTHQQVIYDYDEERQRREAGLEEEKVKPEKVKLKRGVTGVFDIEELVDLLREDNAQDIVAIQVPPELKYVSYMVIVSSGSGRHRRALAELVRGAYKLKKGNADPSVIMEGKGSNWVAMDMGNIVLHIMDPETRETYDLETLWTVGAAFDEKSRVSEEELLGVRRPPDPMAPAPSPLEHSPEAVT